MIFICELQVDKPQILVLILLLDLPLGFTVVDMEDY